jgi:hypothetical protein
VSHFLNKLVATPDSIVEASRQKSGGAATRLYLQTEVIATVLPASLTDGKADNQILAVVMHCTAHQRNVVLVSKDINIASGARARHRRRRLLQHWCSRTDSSTTRCASCGGFLGPARQGWSRGGKSITCYRISSRSFVAARIEFSTREKPGERPASW